MDFLMASLQIKSMSIFEAGMLICFGASWPFSLYKTFKTKSVQGKSKVFSSLVILGYLCGMMHKILYRMDIVFWLYVICMLMVTADFIMIVMYRKPVNKNEITDKNEEKTPV